MRQKCWVTFTKERAPMPEESSKCDTKADVAYWLPLPMWWGEEAPHKEADWSSPREEAGTIPVRGDLNIKCPLPLKPHLQDLLGKEEHSLVSTKVRDGIQPLLASTSTPQLSPHGYPGPSLMHLRVDRVAHQVCADAILVGGAHINPKPCWPQRICLEDACLLWGSQCVQLDEGGGQLPHAASSTPLHGKAPVSTTQGCKVQSPGHLSDPGTIVYVRALQHWAEEVYPQSPANLTAWWGVYRSSGGEWTPHHFHGRRCLHGHGAIPMDRNNLTTVDEGCPPRITKEPHMW